MEGRRGYGVAVLSQDVLQDLRLSCHEASTTTLQDRHQILITAVVMLISYNPEQLETRAMVFYISGSPAAKLHL